ncbi:MAG: NYN domain-containing protein [Candidatus Gracilibacteria bacterium]|nr:NYN domain-containing protein [Candidatus Gracilibacteria bacterium]MDQ7023259.1 NYN domain-containing protein [Candidatus Gracilibacteria bacterium]
MKEKNYAFIDGQNLYQGLNWSLNYKKFRISLKDKYNIEKAYYFIGFKQKENGLYEKLQEAGFILVFNLKGENLKSTKKGNIDTNLVFNVMKKIIHSTFDKVVLVSGDGDYKMMVDYLVEQNRFKKVIVPNLKFASSLYKNNNNLDHKYFVNLDYLKEKLIYEK